MSVEIKKAGIEDIPDAAPLFDGYRIFYKQPSNEKAAADFLRERIIKDESAIFIAYVNKIPVGFCQLYPLFSSVGLQRTWLLNDLYVNANARGQGVAAALLQKAKEFGIATNARWLMLETAADNYTAQSVYENNGWKKSGGVFYEMRLS
jgi:GNAT superfamily N-acetyltransferase